MIRNILGVLVGLIVAASFITSVLYIGWSMYPLPENVSWFVPESYKHLDRAIYPGTYLFEIMAYALGAFLGGCAVAMIVKLAKPAYAMLIGLIIFIFVLVKFIMIPHPGWFNFLSPLPILPMGYFGGKLIDNIYKK